MITPRRPKLKDRIDRFIKRSNSPMDAFRALREEAFVRAYDRPMFRKAVAPFVPLRTPEKWVFLVGCFNSGTTLLQHILSAHPEVRGLPREGVRFTSHLHNLETRGNHMIWGEDYINVLHPNATSDKTVAAEIMQDWSPFWKSGGSVFLDKSVANTARMKWLDENFPNAHFVCLHRNGYCISEGLLRRAIPPQWLKDETGLDHYPIERVAWQWAEANRLMLEGLDAVDRGVLVRFEDLIDDPAKEVSRIMSFLDLSQSDIENCDGGLRVANKSFQIRDPNPSSLARLSDENRSQLKPLLKPMMHQLGYNQDDC